MRNSLVGPEGLRGEFHPHNVTRNKGTVIHFFLDKEVDYADFLVVTKRLRFGKIDPIEMRQK
jgi:hypothetical protein